MHLHAQAWPDLEQVASMFGEVVDQRLTTRYQEAVGQADVTMVSARLFATFSEKCTIVQLRRKVQERLAALKARGFVHGSLPAPLAARCDAALHLR